MIGVHVRTPEIIAPLFAACFDPVPYAGDGLAIPNIDVPEGMPIYWNGDYSRFDEWVDWCIQKHREGHWVAVLIPMGDNAEVRKLRRYGILPLIPEQRFFPSVRLVEIVILTGKHERA